jgi:mRNA-degrading endonuclease toxin of MazEF toxin-antitoxin module
MEGRPQVKNITKENLEKSTLSAKEKLDELIENTNLDNSGDIKRSNNYVQWIVKKTDIIINEPNYVCADEDKLKRGVVVWIEFGFNIGNEFGGRHPAIILRKTGKSVFVVPLSSQKPDVPKNYHVKIDKVYGFKDMERWTNVLKLQNVSIQRIDMEASIGNVKGDVLNKINEALKNSHIF